MDVRPGGERRAPMFAGPDRREIPWEGVYHEVVEPERLVITLSDPTVVGSGLSVPHVAKKDPPPPPFALRDGRTWSDLASICEAKLGQVRNGGGARPAYSAGARACRL
jgi:uncharacterized protein YndB with AHSA1/START domain